jgi:hypothetical protein
MLTLVVTLVPMCVLSGPYVCAVLIPARPDIEL